MTRKTGWLESEAALTRILSRQLGATAAREAAELDEACRPGFEALAARGIQRERPR